MDADLQTTLNAAIRTIPDYPKPGILFRDVTTLMGNPRAFRRAVTDDDVKPFLAVVNKRLAEGYSFEAALRVGFKAIGEGADRKLVRIAKRSGVEIDG